MHISLDTLKNTPGQAVIISSAEDPETLGLTEEVTKFDGPVNIRVEAVYRDGKIHVNGCLRTRVVLSCSRCLKTFICPIEGDFTDDISANEQTELDVTEVVREMYYTSFPIKPLCDEACKGLCTVCGENRNEKDCGCNDEELDHRLAVLKKLLQE